MPKFKPGDRIFFRHFTGKILEAEFRKYTKSGELVVRDINYPSYAFYINRPMTREEAVAVRLLEV